MILESIVAGDTFSEEFELDDYSSDTYDIWIALRGASSIDIKTGTSGVTITKSGGSFTVAVTATATALWTAGDYWFAIYAGKTSWAVKYQVYSGTVKILPSISAQSGTYDGRTHAKKSLDAVEAVIEGRASLDQMSYQIAGRRLDKTPIADLLLLRNEYRAEYKAEKRAEDYKNGGEAVGVVKVQF